MTDINQFHSFNFIYPYLRLQQRNTLEQTTLTIMATNSNEQVGITTTLKKYKFHKCIIRKKHKEII